LKRAFPQKVKPVPSCVAEDTVVGQSKQALPEVNRRARTSAAMIGLAISMGAHSMLIAHQTDEAIAAEPTPGEPTVTAAPSLDVAALSAGTEVTPSTASLSSSGAKVVEYTVQEGQTLWQLAQFYGVDAAKVAALNGVPLNSVLYVGQVLKIPVSNGYGSNSASEETASSISGSGNSTPSSSPAILSRAAANRDVALKVEQDAALDRLKQKREELKLSLTKLKAVKQDLPAATATPTTEISAVSEHQAGAYEASSVSTYQVAVGDTLTEIARSYGISPAKLAAANKLENPNVIRVNQVLVIPPSEAVSRAYAVTAEAQSRASTTVAMLPTAVASDVPVITADTKPDSVLVPIRQTAQPGFQAKIASLPDQEPSAEDLKGETSATVSMAADFQRKDEAAIATAPFVANPSQVDHSPSNLSYSYVENLKQEILKLREKYQTSAVHLQSDSQPATKVATATLTNTSAGEGGSLSTRVNPEFRPEGRADSLRTQIRGLRAKAQDRTIEVSSTSADAYPASSRSASKSESQLVAAAPLGSQTYEPLVPSSLGQMVTPDLPPLGSVENYLPGSSGKFNGYIWPAKGLLTSGFGWRWGRMHKGIDIAAPVGTPVVAAAPGVVVTAGWNSGGYGNLVEVKHPDGSLTLYAHNSRILVREGQQVEQGQQLAEMGSTGYSTGPHCHFEVHPAGQGAMNPMAFLPRVG
jgi:murein DD-endopeptidase MepM/ murein hydrolase activator NlpD